MTDDVESQALLQLRHKTLITMHNLAEVSVLMDGIYMTEWDETLSMIATRLSTLEQEHEHLFRLARASEHMPSQQRRRVHNLACLVISQFHATWITWNRIALPAGSLGSDCCSGSDVSARVDEIISLLASNHIASSLTLLHALNPLFYAAIETKGRRSPSCVGLIVPQTLTSTK